MTKNELIAKFKKEYPIVNKTINGQDIVIEGEEYETLIEQWADNVLAQQENEKTKQTEEIAKANKRAELLARLGITEEEARLLLG